MGRGDQAARDTEVTSLKGLGTHVDQIRKERVKAGQRGNWGQRGDRRTGWGGLVHEVQAQKECGGLRCAPDHASW